MIPSVKDLDVGKWSKVSKPGNPIIYELRFRTVNKKVGEAHCNKYGHTIISACISLLDNNYTVKIPFTINKTIINKAWEVQMNILLTDLFK